MSIDSATTPNTFSPALKIASAYGLIGACWFLVSDWLLDNTFKDGQTLALVQTYEGWIFVFLSAIAIYHLVKKQTTTRSRFEQQLRDREYQLRLALQNAPTAITTSNLTGQFLSANQSACALLGYSEEELCEITDLDITHAEDREEVAQLLQQCSRGELRTYTCEKRFIHKSGEIVYVRVHNGTVYDTHGSPQILVSQLEDLSTRRKAEQDARAHRERLAHVDRVSLLGEMAAGIAHEINQPLTAIANYADAARRRVMSARSDPSKLLTSLEKVSEQAQRAGEVIRRLRALVKRGESHRELADINDLVRDAVKLATVDARIHDMVIDVDLEAEIQCVYVDEIQIQQVVLNLVRNAVDATEEAANDARVVRIHTEVVDGELVEVSVTDSGIGISDEAAEKLFSPFFTTKKSGMGMGLSISHSIINAHGGHLWFTRKVDGGTTFHFTLPLEIRNAEG